MPDGSLPSPETAQPSQWVMTPGIGELRKAMVELRSTIFRLLTASSCPSITVRAAGRRTMFTSTASPLHGLAIVHRGAENII